MFAQTTSAQVASKVYGKPADYKAMKKRSLIVEIPEPDPKTIEKLKKKAKKKPELLKNYNEFFPMYEALITKVVEEHWKLNEEVKFMTTSEVKEIRDSKSKKYVILYYTELADKGFGNDWRSGLTVPALVYSRSEKSLAAHDYRVHIPSSFTHEGGKIMEADMVLAIKMMQSNIEYSIKTNKTHNFIDYGKAMTKENCNKINDKTIVFSKDMLGKKATEEGVEGKSGLKMQFVSEQEWNDIFIEKTPEKAVFFFVPHGIGKGQIGPVSTAALVYLRIMVDAETSEVLYMHTVGFGDFTDTNLRNNDFSDYQKKCK